VDLVYIINAHPNNSAENQRFSLPRYALLPLVVGRHNRNYVQYYSNENLLKAEYYLINMDHKNTAIWLIVAVTLGLFAFSLVGIFVNGFLMYKLYPLILGLINLIAIYFLKK
jgi:hypothetical protein